MTYPYEANKHLLTSSNGQRLTTQLFEELARDDIAAKPVFKLSDWRKKYVEVADPTGYKAAMELIGDWEHWMLLTKSPVFAAHLSEWNTEVEMRLRSDGVANLIKQSKLPTGTAAARWLADAGWTDKADGRRKSKAAPEDKQSKASVQDDAKRIGVLAVVK